jgi:hypothetical protein
MAPVTSIVKITASPSTPKEVKDIQSVPSPKKSEYKKNQVVTIY